MRSVHSLKQIKPLTPAFQFLRLERFAQALDAYPNADDLEHGFVVTLDQLVPI